MNLTLRYFGPTITAPRIGDYLATESGEDCAYRIAAVADEGLDRTRGEVICIYRKLNLTVEQVERKDAIGQRLYLIEWDEAHQIARAA